jgi:hypothetical protein
MPAKRSASAAKVTDETKPAAKKAGKTESNELIATVFDELKMYEIKSGNKFAGVAYDKVAKALRASALVIASGSDVAHLAGVGKASVEKIDEFFTTGKVAKLEEFRSLIGELPTAVIASMKSGGASSGKGKGNGDAKGKPVSAADKKKITKAVEDFEAMSIETLKGLLRKNNGLVSGTKAELTRRCAEGKVLGAFPLCPLCSAGKPKFDIKTGLFKCPGYMDDDKWAPCIFSGAIDRSPWVEA